jgi:hypothetical protein
MSRIILIMQYYLVRNKDKEYASQRQKEVDECLVRNAKNPSLNEIHVLVEKEYDLSFVPVENRTKLRVVNIGKRLTYAFAFEYYNTHLSNEICILANADIYTNRTLEILRHVDFENVVFAMNRYEHNFRDDLILLNGVEVNLCERHKCPYLVPYQASVWSQDSWIWKAPSLQVEDCDFALGTPGCDNYIIYQLMSQHFYVCNPSRLVCTMHIDRLSIRQEEFGVVKGVVSKAREHRVGDMDSYRFVENLDDIPDKYTIRVEMFNSHPNPKYSFIQSARFAKTTVEIKPEMCRVIASSANSCSPSDVFFGVPRHWEPSRTDTNAYIEFQFDTLQRIVMLDLTGKITLRNDDTVGYVRLFRMEWKTETNRTKVEIHKGIEVPNGNVIHRIYMKTPIVTKTLRLYPLQYEVAPAMKIRLFTNPEREEVMIYKN